MDNFTELVKARLYSFGYETTDEDELALVFVIQKVENTIKNECNVQKIPEGLESIAIDMAVGEFLQSKKAFAPDSLKGLDFSGIVKKIQTGDTTVEYSENGGIQSADNVINYLLNYGREQFSCYRKIRW